MPAPLRSFVAAPRPRRAHVGARVCPQASPYIPLDDPRLPLLEHLIARGDIDDPSPMVRPFRRSDAVRVLAAADSGGDNLRPADPRSSRPVRGPAGIPVADRRPGRRSGVQPHPSGRAPSARPRRRPSLRGLHRRGPIRPVCAGLPSGGGAAALGRSGMAGANRSRAHLALPRGVRKQPVQVRIRIPGPDGPQLGTDRARRHRRERLRVFRSGGGLRPGDGDPAPLRARARPS